MGIHHRRTQTVIVWHREGAHYFRALHVNNKGEGGG